ncbi:MAG: Tim44/TimA family putative adaptor protein [Alphaproteobacteria bacterium]
MTLLDILILVVAAALVFELRRVLGRRRNDDATDRRSSSLDQYIRHAQERDQRRPTKSAKSAKSTEPTEPTKPTKPTEPGSKSADAASEPTRDTSRDIGFAEAVRDALASEPTVHPLTEEKTATSKPSAPAISQESADRLAELLRHEPGFRETDFLNGARGAYEQILEAWAVNDYETLDSLLGDPARTHFFESMRNRSGKSQWRATNLVTILSARIVRAVVANAHADLEVEFLSEQFESLRGPRRRASLGAEGGSPREAGPLGSVREIWRFRRPLDGGDPNWLLVETHTLNPV